MKKNLGQVAMEYMILLAMMVIIALTAFRNLLPQAQQKANEAFSSGVGNMVGNAAKTSEAGPWPFDDGR